MKLSDKKTRFIKLLQLGGSGNGKTVAAASFPNPKYIFNFDPEGVQSLLTMYKNDPKFLDGIDYDDYTDHDNTKPTAWKAFEKKKNEFINSAHKGDFPYATIVLDSLTTMEDSMMNELKVINKVSRVLGQPNQQDYGIMIGTMELLIPEILSLPCHVVVNAHTQVVQDGITQEIMRLPLVTGKKLPQKLPLWFGETYLATTKKTGDKLEYVWQIRAGNKFDLKSRVIPPEVPGPIPQKFSEIEKYL